MSVDEEQGNMPDKGPYGLPPRATEFIAAIVRKMRYRKRVRQEVAAELTAHFEDELRDCADADDHEQRAQRLIEEFGDAGLLAVLCRRAKKRCRPLAVRALARTMQAVGVFLMVFIPYTIWFVRGKPNPTIDYLPQLNALHRPFGQAEDNAWPYYEKAMRLTVEPNEAIKEMPWLKSHDLVARPLTPQQRGLLRDWIAANSSAWQQLEYATARRQCHRIYRRRPGKPLLMECTNDPPPAGLRWLALLGRCKARLASEQGRIDESLGYCLTLLRTGAHWQRNASLMEQFAGMAISGSANQDMLRIVSAEESSLAQLSELQSQIGVVYPDGYPSMNFDGERLMMLDAIQHAFTNGGVGGGHLLFGVYSDPRLFDSPVSWWERAMFVSLDVGASMIHAGRDRTIAKVDEWYERMNEVGKLSLYERRQRDIGDMIDSMGWDERLRYSLVQLFTPAEQRMSEMAFRARADYEGLMTVIALKRYRLEKGSHPPDLETLVQDGYLKKVPSDPYGAGALVYRATDDDFVLYSLGPNFTDEGGECGRDEEGRPKVWRANGDMVFWPVGP